MKIYLLTILLVLLFDTSQAKPSANAVITEEEEAIESGAIRQDSKDLVTIDTGHDGKSEASDEKNWYGSSVKHDPASVPNQVLPPIIANRIAEIDATEADPKLKLYHGDILLTKEEQGDENNEKRNALRDRRSLWHSKKIPIQFDTTMTSSDITAIRAAIRDFHAKTCIRFEEQALGSTSKYFVKFFKGGGCYSYMGRVKGARGQNGVMDKFQPISIGRGCGSKGIVIHECMHMLGFFHEQSRYDRDTYLEIYWNNIPAGWQSQFRKSTVDKQTTLGERYDYGGVMHYGKTMGGKIVMAAKVNGVVDQSIQLGQRFGFSQIDIDQINTLYDCRPAAKQGEWSAWSKLSPCLTNNRKIKQRFCYSETPSACPATRQAKVTTSNGVQTYITDCSTTTTAVDGNWGRWSAWSTCSSACRQSRSRQCNNPAPSNGGAACGGSSSEMQNCNNGACPGPVTAQWETWSNWGSCSKQQRARKCTSKGNPASTCPGDSIETKNCMNNCKVDGKWGLWSAWGRCSVSCEIGKETRTRKCNNPPPQNRGADCTGASVETQNCNAGKCTARTTKPPTMPPTRMPPTRMPPTNPPSIQDPLSCSFENGACDWVGDTSSALKWKSSKVSPIGDHTSEKGYFMELKSSDGNAGDTASVLSSSMISDGYSKCFELFYYMYGSQMGTLDVRAVYNDRSGTKVKKNLMSITGNRGNQWSQGAAELDFPARTTFSIEISGTLGGKVGSNIAIDDLTLWNGACPKANKVPTPSILRCAFEHGVCNWRQIQGDKFDWTRRKGTTPSTSQKTGPTQSSTGPNDYYIYIETSYPRNDKDNAILQSPEFASRVPSCLKFKYNMYGANIGQLIVRQVDSKTYSRKDLWTQSGEKGNMWLQAEINLPPNEGIQVEIEGIRGSTYKGDIAIDEIQLQSGKC